MKTRIVFISFIWFVVIAFIFMVLFFFGIIGPKDEGKERQEILNLVPVGLPIPEAKKRMESYGFKCEWVENKEFAVEHIGVQQKMHPKADFLYCDREKGSIFILMAIRWQVEIVAEKGVVKEVFISVNAIAT